MCHVFAVIFNDANGEWDWIKKKKRILKKKKNILESQIVHESVVNRLRDKYLTKLVTNDYRYMRHDNGYSSLRKKLRVYFVYLLQIRLAWNVQFNDNHHNCIGETAYKTLEKVVN